ncbi:MAG: AI-2E family transporter [Propionibacteriaceae bacterium]|nr:AI-2E family transporter [Propionibacteriaceae bacterium]
MRLQHWLGLCAIVATGLLFWSLREVLIHLFAAIVLAMALCTLVGALRQRWRIPRPLALLMCILGLVLTVGVGLTVIVPPFTSQFQQLILQLPAAAKALKELVLQGFSSVSAMIYGSAGTSDWRQLFFPKSFADGPSAPEIASSVSGGLARILGLAGNLGSGLIQLLFVFAVTLMVAVQPHSYKNVGIQLLPSFYRRRARVILGMCGDALSSWMIGVLISSVCVAVLAGIGLSLLGVKLVMANALLAGLLNIIPNVGPTLSTIFPMSVALLDAPWKALAVLGLYIVVQQLESYVITPSVMQRQVNLLPGLTLAAQFLFTVLFGPLGLLLALPLAVVLQVLIREVIVHDLLDPWKRQRLLS